MPAIRLNLNPNLFRRFLYLSLIILNLFRLPLHSHSQLFLRRLLDFAFFLRLLTASSYSIFLVNESSFVIFLSLCTRYRLHYILISKEVYFKNAKSLYLVNYSIWIRRPYMRRTILSINYYAF